MKTLFKFTVIALGIAAVALSVVAIANHLCRDKYCFCGSDDFDDFNGLED
ncbi:MAG: hypothetical protein FWG70_11065 [Oscillospiraceae bacterium]|nr:hypothetical protein [Oscillospiraceae bacterium]